MISVHLEFHSLDEVREFFGATSSPIRVVTDATEAAAADEQTGASEPSKPKKGGRKAKSTEAQTGAGGSAADPLAGILAPQSPVMTPPVQPAVAAVIQSQLAAPPQVQTTAAEPPKAVEFKDLIAKFTELGKAKGRDAIAGVLAQFSAQQLPDIKQENWAKAIALCNQALAA